MTPEYDPAPADEPYVPTVEDDAWAIAQMQTALVNGHATNGTHAPSDPGSFRARVLDRHVNLFQRIREGIPPIDYLPASDGMLVRGKRHQIVAPKKTGKSFSMLVHWVDMTLAGAQIVILDRENGADLYAQRLQDILSVRGITGEAQDEIEERMAYYEFPRLDKDDNRDLVAAFAHADVVVFDSQRLFLTDLGLEENSSDHYATFATATIDPLFQHGIASVVLDNSGHDDPKRSRGSSSKGDLNEILFSLAQAEGFDQETTGRVILTVEDSRFGNRGTWEMRIGGGVFEPWKSGDPGTRAGGKFTPTHLMAKVSETLAIQPTALSKSAIAQAVTGRRTAILAAVDRLYEYGYLRFDGKGYTHYKSYREGDQLPEREPVPASSHQFPEPAGEGSSAGSPPHRGYRNRGTARGERNHDQPVPGSQDPDDDIPF